MCGDDSKVVGADGKIMLSDHGQLVVKVRRNKTSLENIVTLKSLAKD